jgi:beta-phosphoglucomutase
MIRKNKIAVIFDLDGTIVDNKQYHIKAWVEFCRRYGVSMTEEQFENKGFGRSNKDYLSEFLQTEISDKDDFRYGEEKEQIYRELYAPYIKPINGAIEFIKLVKYNSYKTAIASMAPLSNIQFVLNKLKINGYFDVIIDYYQVKKGKPDPEIFLKAARNLRIAPSDCVVIEDSIIGIQAAKNAGTKVIGIETYHDKNELEMADITIKDFTEISSDQINKLFK